LTQAETVVPNTFEDGTPAEASEVNANFDALADGVNAQDVKIQTLEEESISQEVRLQELEGENEDPVHTFTYTKNDHEAGYEFQMAGVDYRLVDLPIYEYSTGDRYVVRYPLAGEYTSARWSFSHNSNPTFIPKSIAVDIDGYEGHVTLSEGMTYSVNVPHPFGATEFTRASSCSLSLTILETTVNVNSWGSSYFAYLVYKSISEDISPQDTSANSYVDSVPAPPERDPDLVRTVCDDLIDYIQVFGPSQARDTPPSTQQAN